MSPGCAALHVGPPTSTAVGKLVLVGSCLQFTRLGSSVLTIFIWAITERHHTAAPCVALFAQYRFSGLKSGLCKARAAMAKSCAGDVNCSDGATHHHRPDRHHGQTSAGRLGCDSHDKHIIRWNCAICCNIAQDQKWRIPHS